MSKVISCIDYAVHDISVLDIANGPLSSIHSFANVTRVGPSLIDGVLSLKSHFLIARY